MKKPLVDMPALIQSAYLGNKQYIAKFIRNWGTAMVYDTVTETNVEVLRGRNYIYPMNGWDPKGPEETAVGRSTSGGHAEKFLKYSGGWDSVLKQKWKGIKRAWIEIKPSKDSFLTDTLIREQIEEAAVNAPDSFQFTVTMERTKTVKYLSSLATSTRSYCSDVRDAPAELLEFQATKDYKGHLSITRYHRELKAELLAKKDDLWRDYLFTTRYSDPCVDVLAVYSLLFGEVDLVQVAYGLTKVSYEETAYDGSSYPVDKSIPTIAFTFTMVKDTFLVDDPRWIKIKEGLENTVEEPSTATNLAGDTYTTTTTRYAGINTARLQSIRYPGGYSQEEGDPASKYGQLGFFTAISDMVPHNKEIWVNSGRDYYLRTDFLRTGRIPGKPSVCVTLEERVKLLTTEKFIDIGYQEKDCDFWCSVTKIAVIVIAIVVSFVVPGVGGAAGLALVAAIAQAIVLFSLIITLATAVIAGLGNDILAREMGRFNQTIAPLVQVAGVVAIVTGVYMIAENMASDLAIDQAEQQLAQQFGAQGFEMATFNAAGSVASSLAETMTNKVMESVVGQVTDLSVGGLVQSVSRVANMWTGNEMANTDREIRNLTNENAKLQAQIEEMQISDKGLQIMRMYANPIQNQWARDYSIFESYCEPSSRNIQATHVAAVMHMGAQTYFGNRLVKQTAEL